MSIEPYISEAVKKSVKNNLFTSIQDFKKNKILYSYWKTLAVTFLIPFLLIIALISGYYRYILVNQTISNQMNTLYQKQKILDQTAYEAEIAYSQFSDNNIITDFFTVTNYDDFDSELKFNMNSFIKATTLLSPNLESVYLYNPEIDTVYTNHSSYFLSDMKDTFWFDAYKEKGYSFVFARVIDGKFMITYCFENSISLDTKGLIVFNFNLSDFFSYSSNEYIKLCDNEAKVFSIEDSKLSVTDDVKLAKKLFLERNGSITKLNTVTSYITSTDGIFKIFIEDGKIFSGYEYFVLSVIVLFIMLLALGIAFALSYILSSKLYNYVTDIVLTIDGGETSEEKDELKRVIRSVAVNSVNSTDVEAELAEKVSLLRQSQTVALQTQITPHFLYNTLQAINFTTLKLCKGDNDASKMIVLFSDLLHAALDTKSYLVPMSEEIKYAEKYLEIQQFKYGDKFQFILDLAEGTENLTVIKLMLQPIIENAIHHGILPTKKRCRIILSTMISKDNKFIIKVTNDGVGISPDKLYKLNQDLENPVEIKQARHIGLSNVNQRIKLIFGDEYGCYINSNNEFTAVIITLPLK